MIRRVFPDLHFELHDIIEEGEVVATRSTMTGTHLGRHAQGTGQGARRPGARGKV
jgi:predicted ester cyclase